MKRVLTRRGGKEEESNKVVKVTRDFSPPCMDRATTTSTTVFWPEDVKTPGICFGWDEPCICVAGTAKCVDVCDFIPSISLVFGAEALLEFAGCFASAERCADSVRDWT